MIYAHTSWHPAFDAGGSAFRGVPVGIIAGQIWQAITERRLLLDGGTPFPAPNSMTARAWWRAVYQAVMCSDTYGATPAGVANHGGGYVFSYNATGGCHQAILAQGDTAMLMYDDAYCLHHYLNPVRSYQQIEDLSDHAGGQGLPASYVSYYTDLKLLEVTGLTRFVCPRGFDPRNPQPGETNWESFYWGDNSDVQFDLWNVFPRTDGTPSFLEFLTMIKKVICAKNALCLVYAPYGEFADKGPKFGAGLVNKTCQIGLRLVQSTTHNFPTSISFDKDGYALIPANQNFTLANLKIESVLTLK